MFRADSPSQKMLHLPEVIFHSEHRLCNSSKMPSSPRTSLRYADWQETGPGEIAPAVIMFFLSNVVTTQDAVPCPISSEKLPSLTAMAEPFQMASASFLSEPVLYGSINNHSVLGCTGGGEWDLSKTSHGSSFT